MVSPAKTLWMLQLQRMRGDQADEIHTITRISVIHGCAHAHYCIYRLSVYKSYNDSHFHEDPYSNSDH